MSDNNTIERTDQELKDQIVESLKTVYDPEIPVDIWELGLIYEINVKGEDALEIIMTLTAPNCPAAGILPAEVEEKAKSVPGIKEVDVQVTFDPPWDMSMMSEEARLELGMM